MRRVSRSLVVASLALSLAATTASAAPRRDSDGTWFIPKKIVQIIQRVVHALDVPTDLSWPKP